MTEHDQLDIGLRYDEEPPRRRFAHRLGRFVLFLVAAAVVIGVPVGLLVGGSHLLRGTFSGGPADYSGSGTGSVTVQVKPGDSLAQVANALYGAGVVKSAGAFTAAAQNNPKAATVQPGYYRLHQHMSGAAALGLLLTPSSRIDTNVTVPEGFTAAEIYAKLAATTPLTVADLQAAAKRTTDIGLPPYAHGHVEGFLFPATYQVDPGTTAADILAQMITTFGDHATALKLTAQAQALHLTPYQVITVASIVEKEAGLQADFPKVARVIYNRLNKGMLLQLDSTLNYVLPHRKGTLSLHDLKNPSPYNTYRHKGLPPTPISNPGDAALKAALNPASGNWLYFVTVDKAGHTAFTNSYQQFLRLKAQASRNGVIK